MTRGTLISEHGWVFVVGYSLFIPYFISEITVGTWCVLVLYV